MNDFLQPARSVPLRELSCPTHVVLLLSQRSSSPGPAIQSAGAFPQLTDSECADGRRQLRSKPSGFRQPSLAQAG